MDVDPATIVARMRMVTELTGQIYDGQIDTLKKNAVLLFGHPLTITLDAEPKGEQNQRLVTLYTRSTPDPAKEQTVQQVVSNVLGKGFVVQVCYDDYRDSTSTLPADKPVAARTKRVRKVPSKRKAASKSKNRR